MKKVSASAAVAVVLGQLIGLAFTIGVFLTDHVGIIQGYCVYTWVLFGYLFLYNVTRGVRAP